MELGLLTTSEQFAKIHVHENNKCAEAIQPMSVQAHDQLILTKSQPFSAQALTETLVTIQTDNQSSILLTNNSVLHTRTKHNDIQHYYTAMRY